jgi:hypothetical protein
MYLSSEFGVATRGVVVPGVVSMVVASGPKPVSVNLQRCLPMGWGATARPPTGDASLAGTGRLVERKSTGWRSRAVSRRLVPVPHGPPGNMLALTGSCDSLGK